MGYDTWGQVHSPALVAVGIPYAPERFSLRFLPPSVLPCNDAWKINQNDHNYRSANHGERIANR